MARKVDTADFIEDDSIPIINIGNIFDQYIYGRKKQVTVVVIMENCVTF